MMIQQKECLKAVMDIVDAEHMVGLGCRRGQYIAG